MVRRMHPSTLQLLSRFNYSHLARTPARDASRRFQKLAHELATFLPDGPETTVALRKLLESKDAAVRAALGDVEIELPEENVDVSLRGGLQVSSHIDAATVYGIRDRGACPICGAAPTAVCDGARHEQHDKAAAVQQPANPRDKQ
jgi:hypothetical protein